MVSVRTAAQMTHTSKTTIQRHIKTGKLSAKRNDAEEWEIDPAELARVMTVYESEHGETLIEDPARPTSSKSAKQPEPNPEQTAPHREIELLQQQITMLENERQRERDQLQARIDELATQCHDWKKQASNQTLLLSNEQERNQRPLWSRLFG